MCLQIAADGTQLSNSFSIKLYIFIQGAGNSIAATSKYFICYFNLPHIEIAEYIASDTFLKASENWAINGVPESSTARLYTVGKNKTKDYFKHSNVFETQIRSAIKPNEIETEQDFEFSNQNIADSQFA